MILRTCITIACQCAILVSYAQDSTVVVQDSALAVFQEHLAANIFSLSPEEGKQFRLVEKCTRGMGAETCQLRKGPKLSRMLKYFRQKNTEEQAYGAWYYVISYRDESTIIISGDQIVSTFRSEKYIFEKLK